MASTTKVAVMRYRDGEHVGDVEMERAEWELYAASGHPDYQWPEGIARAGDVLQGRELAALGLDEDTTIYLE
jgi:hypothetical protein